LTPNTVASLIGWTDIIRYLAAILPRKADPNASPLEMGRMMELADFKKMNQIRARVDAVVRDKRTAEALKPWYRQFCKLPPSTMNICPH
jgi:cyclohexanone monooxygenase